MHVGDSEKNDWNNLVEIKKTLMVHKLVDHKLVYQMII